MSSHFGRVLRRNNASEGSAAAFAFAPSFVRMKNRRLLFLHEPTDSRRSRRSVCQSVSQSDGLGDRDEFNAPPTFFRLPRLASPLARNCPIPRFRDCSAI